MSLHVFRVATPALLLALAPCLAQAQEAAPSSQPAPAQAESAATTQPEPATPTVEPAATSPGEAPAVSVDPPRAAAVERVTVDFHITGLEEPELTNAYNWLGYVAEDQREGLVPNRLKTLHDEAEKSIAKSLQPYGYYQPRISKRLEGGPKDYFAYYSVERGPLVRWLHADIRLSGPGAEALQERAQVLGPPTGARLRHSEYEDSKDRLLALAHGEGYLDASFSQAELRIDPEQGSAQAVLVLDTGPRWQFGEAVIEGDSRIDEDVIRRYLRCVPGEPYSQQKLLDTQFALTDLDYFSKVEVGGLRSQASEGRIPVQVRVEHSKSRRDDFGLGYGTDTGARASVGTEFRRFNSRGHKLRVAVRASQKLSGASGEYRLPIGNEPGEYVGLSGDAGEESLSYGVERKYSLAASLNRLDGDWDRRYYLKFQRSLFDFAEGEDSAVSVLAPGLTLSRQWLDDPAYARYGFSFWADGHGGQKGLLSDASFLQGRMRLKGALPLGREGRLLARVEIGATAAAEFNKLPPDERFFAGGDQSVRGYSYQSIGASRDDNGGVIGGRYLNVFSLEAERAIKGALGLALFGDAGGVGDSPAPELHFGVGLGLRYRAPFGSVTVDLAHPLDPGEPVVRLHLGVRVGL
ncbi:MAG: hypothetical protein EPN60_04650 [Nevskiaceae bacterium]|nr:MAG: hypothetical protein EPO48_11355 [Nevskiaceae bacterium]TAM31037.1 MAG: hypothetical protein EPN60_04650 [Nevskiaceae bacterium]